MNKKLLNKILISRTTNNSCFHSSYIVLKHNKHYLLIIFIMINLFLFSILFIYFFKNSNNQLINCLFETTFLINSENWTIIGNKKTNNVLHQTINIDNKMSNYITAKDDLINVDYKNKNDKDLWYFKSPLIRLPFGKKPFLLSFTMRSFLGDFKKLNYCHALIKIRSKGNTFFYPYVKKYDGNIETFNIPLLNELWFLEDNNNNNNTNNNNNNILLDSIFNDEFQIEILGDWTQGVEIIGLDNIKIL